jgi:transposase
MICAGCGWRRVTGLLKQLLRHGRIFREGKTAWTKLHRVWLARERLDDPLAQEALEQLLIHVDGIERQLDTPG